LHINTTPEEEYMDMFILGVVWLTAFAVIPRLWWTRGLSRSAIDRVPGWKAQEKLSVARGSRGMDGRESGIRALDPVISGVA
jgi:hypothetical protein